MKGITKYMLSSYVLKAYHHVVSSKQIRFFRMLDTFLQKAGGHAYVRTIGQLKYRLRFENALYSRIDIHNTHWDVEREVTVGSPLVSILLPCSEDMANTFSTALSQTYKNVEVICIFKSKEQSFYEWINRCIDKAHGKFLWIAPDANFTNKCFIENSISLFKYGSVMAVLENTVNISNEDGSTCYFPAHRLISSIQQHDPECCHLTHMLIRNPKAHLYISNKNANEADWLCRVVDGGIVGVIANHSSLSKELCTYVIPNETTTHDHTLRVAMVCYALKSGGGETYPIYLANELRKQGITVTLINLGLEPEEQPIINQIDASIPVIYIKHTDYLGKVLQQLHVDIIHTHQATADYFVARWITKFPNLGRHIITLHGMYETISHEDCSRTIEATQKSNATYVYIADKNLECFKQRNLFDISRFYKIPNGLPKKEIHPIDRKALHIKEDDFVFVLASRPLPEKGWKVAIDAITQMQKKCRRTLQLVILGDGELRSKLESASPDYIHFMGTVDNVQDYFAMGDAGILPSTYRGESLPLSVAECLMTGHPVIASDLGEIRWQLSDTNGALAGELLPVKDWALQLGDICAAIHRIVDDTELYNQKCCIARSACQKFDMEKCTKQYVKLYKKILKL